MYKDGTCRLHKSLDNYEMPRSVVKKTDTNLKAIMRCPLLDTGFVSSRYTVKLSSRHRISGVEAPPGDLGELGDCTGVWTADATMPHIGHPGFGANDIGAGSNGDHDENEAEGAEDSADQ